MSGRDWDREARDRRVREHGVERFAAARPNEEWLGVLPKPDLGSVDCLILGKAERRLVVSYAVYRGVVTREPGRERRLSLLALLRRLDHNTEAAERTIAGMCKARAGAASRTGRGRARRVAWLRAAIGKELKAPCEVWGAPALVF